MTCVIRLVFRLYGRESICSKTHTNEFCGKKKLAHERRVAGLPHPGGRRIYESGRPNWVWEQSQSQTRRGARTPSVSYLIDNHYAVLNVNSKICSFTRGTAVGVDFHETGRSGSTAYWNCLEAPWAHAL